MAWSNQQECALKQIGNWLNDPNGKQFFYLAGYAGSGKSTLATEIASMVSGNVVYGAFTGKAALVMRRKGCLNAMTIHSMIYSVKEDRYGLPRFYLNKESLAADAGLVIIDEVSMVSEELGRVLLSFGTRVLVLGDPGQLPPVKGAGYFTSNTPDVMLTEIHRQAQDNPIIRLSMQVREGGKLDIGAYGESKVIPVGAVDRAEVIGFDQVLVGKNLTRRTYNQRIRQLKGFSGDYPQKGERLVCLKNSREKGLLNGGLWEAAKVKKPILGMVDMVVQPDDAGGAAAPVDVSVHELFFSGREGELTRDERKHSDEFDYGWALTVHKSQGSQWNSVYIFDESGAFREDARRWLYTAVTRAAEKVTVVAM